eukprot:5830878-Prymnesium_polylepis.1
MGGLEGAVCSGLSRARSRARSRGERWRVPARRQPAAWCTAAQDGERGGGSGTGGPAEGGCKRAGGQPARAAAIPGGPGEGRRRVPRLR